MGNLSGHGRLRVFLSNVSASPIISLHRRWKSGTNLLTPHSHTYLNISSESHRYNAGGFCYPERQVIILTTKQRKFCDEYLVSSNATDAAIKAGYSPKAAKQTGNRLLTFVDLRAYIDAELERLHSAKIADVDEIMQYLTSVMRGESSSEVVVTELVGDGCSEVRRMDKAPDEKERLKAAELLGKRYGLFEKKPDDIAGGKSVEEDALTASLRELAKEMDDADQ